MRKAFKFRLSPNKAQETVLLEMLETQRLLYNRSLAERRDAWKEEGRSVTYYDQCKALTVERKGHEYLSKCYAQTCQTTLKRLDKAFQNFFRRVKENKQANGKKKKPGYPRFKVYGRFNSIEFPQFGGGCNLDSDNKQLYVFGVGQVKIKLHRAIEGKVKTCTIKREADHWFAVFSCELPDVEVPPSPLPPVGIDLGLKAFIVTSEGEVIESQRHFAKEEKKLAKLQRRMSRKQKGSKNRSKARVKVARLHQKIANRRADFHHKTALKLVRSHGAIAREQLNIKGLCQTRLAKAVYDAGWAQFLGILERKAVEAGVSVVPVNARNTTQMCSRCGAIPQKRLTLADRVHRCGCCGQELDRDLNAARNIFAAAFG